MKKIAAVLMSSVIVMSSLPSVIATNVEIVSDNKTIFYVSVDGNDNNPGTVDAPFASVEKARDTLRSLKASGELSEGGAVVYIREGEYTIQNGITFSFEDSGTADAPIVYRNYPDEKVEFIGGARISPDKFHKVSDSDILKRIADDNARDNVLEVDMFSLGYTSLPEQTWPGTYSYSWGMTQVHGKSKPEAVASELIVDGTAMTIARYPNEGYMNIKKVVEPGENVRNWYDDRIGTPEYIPPEKRKQTPFTITVGDDRVSKWNEAKDALITGSFFFAWADQTVPVANVDVENNSITSKYPSEYTVQEDMYFYIYNLLEEIDIPGEYFAEREKGKIYLYPPENGIGDVIFTSLDEYMFSLDKTEYVTIKGIDMSYMRNGAVRMTDTSDCEVVACNINYTGNVAIKVTGKNNRVYDCYIYDVNKGIEVSGGDKETLTHSMNVIENNHIERADRITNTYSQGITIGGVGNYVLHNKLNDSDHNILWLGGNENVIAYNEIFDACQHTDDMGAVYAGRNLLDRGNKILHNYIHDIGGDDLGGNGVQGVFLDDFWSAALIEGNVFENVTGGAVKFAGSHNEVINNLFVNCDKTAGLLNRSYNYGATDSEHTYRKAIEEAPYIYNEIWLERYPTIANVISKDDKLDMNNNIVAKNNVLYNTPDFSVSAQISSTATIKDNLSYSTDPGFYDIENKNYLLKEDSQIYEKNPEFKPILFTRMGNYSERAINRIKNAYVMRTESPYMMKKGERIKNDRNIITVINGQEYIPLRLSAEMADGTIDFDGTTNKVSIVAIGKNIEFISGGQIEELNVNGIVHKLSAPIVITEGVNYISVKDIASVYGKQVVNKENLIIVSDVENLFTENDEGILRYIEEQITIY